MKQLKVLLLGYGSIGRRHHANLINLVSADIVVVDPALSKGTLGCHGTLVGSLDEVGEEFDLALICTPTNLHESQLPKCLDLARFVFVEKPVFSCLPTTLPSDVLNCGDRIMVGCNYRFEKGLSLVKELLNQKVLGRVIHAAAEYGHYLPNWRPGNDYRNDYSAYRNRGGGIILDRIHELDYLYWLFGSVRQVMGLQGKLSSLEVDCEDIADFLIQFKSGPMATVHLDYLQRVYTCTLKIVGDKGTIFWSFNPSTVEIVDESGSVQRLYHDPFPDVNAMYFEQMRFLLDVVAGLSSPSNTLGEAMEVLSVALQVREGPCVR